jgi:Flp pilus assembly protein TadD
MKQRSAIQPLVKEKIPLFILSIVSAIITVRAPETMSSPDRLPVWLRLENALVSCCIYFRQTFWPVELAAVYPNPTHGFPIWELAGCATLLGAITAAAYRWRSRQPALLIGWLWFLGMLAPVIGLTQISYYSHADRYTYLPQIGLLIGIAWVAADWAGDVRLRRMALGAVAVVILCILPVAAAQQTGYWHDSDALWAHTLACTRDNSVALNSVGLTRMRQGRLEEAITKFRAAIQINPDYAEAHDNLGYTLSQMGRTAEAMSEYNEALRIAPAYSVAHSNLGNALVVQGHAEDAMAEFQEALQLDPTNGAAANGLGDVLLRQGHAEEAAAQFREAVQYSPTDPLIEVNLARALLLEGQIENAVTEMRKALQLAQGQKNATLASSLAHELSLYEAALQPAGH